MYNWFKIFNTDEFEAAGFVSRTYTYILDAVGQKSFLVTKGNLYGITIGEDFLCVDMNSKNPFAFEGSSIYKDDNNDVWWGFPIET